MEYLTTKDIRNRLPYGTGSISQFIRESARVSFVQHRKSFNWFSYPTMTFTQIGYQSPIIQKVSKLPTKIFDRIFVPDNITAVNSIEGIYLEDSVLYGIKPKDYLRDIFVEHYYMIYPDFRDGFQLDQEQKTTVLNILQRIQGDIMRIEQLKNNDMNTKTKLINRYITLL